MTDPSTAYEKFPGKHRKFIGNDHIWFGADHLLMVSSTGISEDYKRFYYKEIQALNVMKTKTRMIYLITAFVLLGLTGAITAGVYTIDNHNPAVFIPAGIIAFILICYLIRLFIKGPYCKTFIYSSVQKENLTPLNTTKKSQKFLNIILPKIEASQGVLDTEISASMAQRLTAAPNTILKNAAPAAKKIISPVWHRILFLSLMAFGVLMSALVLFRSPVLFAVSGIVLMLIVLINTAVLVKQTGSTFNFKIKAVSVTSMVFVFLTIGCGYIEFIFFMIKNMEEWAKSSRNQWELTKLYARINPFDYPLILGLDIFLIAAFFILGLAGLISVRRQGK